MLKPTRRDLLITAWILGLWLSGITGGLLVVYAAVAQISGQPWPPLEMIALRLSSYLTILGTLLTAVSIYFYSPQNRPPEVVSRYFAAPIVATSATIALWFLFRDGTLPPVAVNGFAILAITGGLGRLVPDLQNAKPM